MFFKNLTAFKILELDIDSFESAINKLAFIPCGKSQRISRGFINPFIKDDNCLFRFNHLAGFCLAHEEKILPAQVVNQEAESYIQELELTRYVSKKEKREIKEDTEQRLLPLAFTKFKKTYGYIDLLNKYIVVNSVAEKMINEVIELLQRCGARFELVIKEESNVLTDWFINGTNPIEVEFANKCKLTSDIGDGVANISCQGSTVLDENIKSFVESGGYITEMAIVWRDQLAMTINTKLQAKTIKFLDVVKDNEMNDHGHETDLLLMADMFHGLLESMQTWQVE